MELLIIISSILRRYHFVLADPDQPVSAHAHVPKFLTGPTACFQLATREGFLRKPVECRVGIRRRQF